MALMRRGANVALTREIPGLRGIVVGARFAVGAEQSLLDQLVFAAVLCDQDSRALSDEHVVFFNQLSSPDLSVSRLTEALGGDSEQLEIDLTAVPAEVARVVLVAYLNDGIGGHRTLGQLRECTVRVLNLATDAELVRSENLAGSLSKETALVLGEVYRLGAEWKFKVIGLGYAEGIVGVARDYGVPL